jgi:Domain of unknown function (DUF3859)
MKRIIYPAILMMLTNCAVAQNHQTKDGKFEFVELSHGIAKVVEGTSEKLKNSPTGTRGILRDFEIAIVTDSVEIKPKANFGILYTIKSKEDTDIDVTFEWIYPEKIETEKGKKIKSLKFTLTRPSNYDIASSYSLDTPSEMVKGNWTLNIYIKDELLFTRTFVLY